MPSKSKAQHNLMEGVAHNPDFAKKVGIPQSVGKEFVAADKGRSFASGGSAVHKGYKGKVESFAEGGAVLGRDKDFIKQPDRFREHQFKAKTPSTDEVFGKGLGHGVGESGHNKAPAPKDKSLSPVKPRS